jgi:hypothetical protein
VSWMGRKASGRRQVSVVDVRILTGSWPWRRENFGKLGKVGN